MPSILYASEALLIRKKELKLCEQMQSRLAKRMLGVPNNTASVAAQVLVGFVPMRAKYYHRVLKFFYQMKTADENSLFHRSYRTCKELGPRSHYWREVKRIIKRCKWDGEKSSITKCVNEYVVGFMNRSLAATKKTGFSVPEVTVDSLGSHAPALDSSKMGRTAASFVLLNSGLGNRTPLPGKSRVTECALCGLSMDEVHLLFSCPVLEPIREKVGLRDFMNLRPGLDSKGLYIRFWDVWTTSKRTLNVRVKVALFMRRAYLKVLARK